jgi:hypothetical protein
MYIFQKLRLDSRFVVRNVIVDVRKYVFTMSELFFHFFYLIFSEGCVLFLTSEAVTIHRSSQCQFCKIVWCGVSCILRTNLSKCKIHGVKYEKHQSRSCEYEIGRIFV